MRKAKDSANRRSVDAYGKSIELAVASYVLDTGNFPISIDQLTIEYSGKEVVCGVAKLNEDSSIYLSECKVGGAEVKDSSTDDGWYHYGKSSATAYQSYSIGDEVTYNGMNFYVIENSDESSETVTMLKAEPLTVDEVNTYGAGHVNRYTYDSVGTSYEYDYNGYGEMAYYSSTTCGYVNGSWVYTGCTTDYAQSEVKYVVDAWAVDKLQSSDLKEDTTGYSARLITYDELFNNLGYNKGTQYSTSISTNKDYTPDWVNGDYWYWTMSSKEDSASSVWLVYFNSDARTGNVLNGSIYGPGSGSVRPVVSLNKSAIK